MDVSHLVEVRPAPRVLFDRAAAHPDRIRFRIRQPDGSWTPVTWRAFADDVRAVAASLLDRGIGPGDHVAVFGANSLAWACAALGVQAAGATMVPIYPASTAEQVRYVVDHADCRLVFVTAGLRATLAAAGVAPPTMVIGLDDAPAGDDPLAAIGWRDFVDAGTALDRDRPAVVDERLAAIDLDAPGLMLYTSGTSGPPKGVPLSHRNVGVNGADWLRNNAPVLAEGDRDLLWLPFSHIFGWGELCSGNLLGWESWMVTPADVLATFAACAPQVFMSVPAYWEKLARAVDAAAGPAAAPGSDPATAAQRDADRRAAWDRLTGGNLRFCLSGGAGLKREIKESLRALGALVIEGYGLTETSPTLTINAPGAYRFDSVGRPLPSVELRLADDGEILARGESVFRGYHRDPDATRAAFTDDGWFKTGDIGRFTDDGFLQIIDRKKDILVTAGGKNVPPVNIEARFATDPAIERVVVYGDGKPYLVAAVWVAPEVAAGEREATVAARIEAINAALARFETIKKFWIADEPLTVEAGLLTSSLKLRRKAVYERFRDRFEALYA